MRWKARKVERPIPDSIRQIWRFLWLPTMVGSEWIWLESVLVEQRFLLVSWLDVAYIIPKFTSVNSIRWPRPGMSKEEQLDQNYNRIHINNMLGT